MNSQLILRDIQEKKIAPVYIFHGEEPFFIDELSSYISDHLLSDEERAFNQLTIYGKEAEALSIISELKSYPVMAERRLVIIKEAQDFKELEKLENYIENPLSTSTLVICHKYKKIDSRKKLMKYAVQKGVVFKSDKIKDYKLGDWIQQLVRKKGYSISSKACMLLIEFLGNDLSKISNEIDKLSIILSKGTTINDVHIEENIGISKDYNVFELNNAIAKKDLDKAFKIIQYFQYNPKAVSFVHLSSTLFRFFTQLMRIHFLSNKSRESISKAIGVHPFVAGELLQSSSLYSPQKVAKSIEILYEYDLKSKGVNSSNVAASELMKEMVFKIVQQ